MLKRLVRPSQPGRRKSRKRNRLQLSKALHQSRKPKSRRNHQIQAQLEKSLAVLSNLKDLEFHSRANIEKLAELSLTIEEELKQKAFRGGNRRGLRAHRMLFNPRS